MASASKSNLTPDGRNALWLAVEPRLRRAGNAFTTGEMSFEQYCDEVQIIRNLLDV